MHVMKAKDIYTAKSHWSRILAYNVIFAIRNLLIELEIFLFNEEE